MWGFLARAFGSAGVFLMSLVLMAVVCTVAWDSVVNGKVYYCTDGGTLDFIFIGDWVHHPESVAHVVPRGMSEPDEIKNGWSLKGLWCLWSALVAGSVLMSAMFACLLWWRTSPNTALQATAAAPSS